MALSPWAQAPSERGDMASARPPFDLENREPKLLSLAFVCVRAPGTGQEGFLLLIRMLIGDWGANAAKPGL
jgi:hypothetical protein